MNDSVQETLSRYLDDALADRERRAFEAALDRDPALRAELERQRRLQELAAGLAFSRGAFSPDEVRERLGRERQRGPGRRVAVAAAAALLLALSHAAAYRLGGGDGGDGGDASAPPAPPTTAERVPYTGEPLDTVARAEGLLARAARIDPARQPPEELQTRLVAIEDELESAGLTDRLARVAADGAAPADLRERAAELLDGMNLLGTARETYADAGLRGLVVARVARELREGPTRLRAVPAGTQSWIGAVPLDDGRVRVRIVRWDEQGRPHVTEQEGTIEEFRARNLDIRPVSGGSR